MKIKKVKNRNHPMAFVDVVDGVLRIEVGDKKYCISTIDDWNKFVDLGLEFPNGFICSSSVDFPEESGASEELVKVIREGFGR